VVVVVNVMCSMADLSRMCMCMYLWMGACIYVYVTDFPTGL
jgi:hypothetical protein